MRKGQYYNKIEKKLLYKWMILLLIAILTAASIIHAPKKSKDVQAATVTHGVAVNNEIPEETGIKKGTASNPFVILEIVPYEGFAEIGYLIDGCEPVKINKMYMDATSICTIGSFQGAVVTGPVEVAKFELDRDDIPSKWEYISYTTKSMTGYYERVADGTGTFKQTISADGKNATYAKVSSGNFKWVTVEGLDLTKLGTDHNATQIGDRVYTTRTDHYYRSYQYTYRNKNLFLKDVLHLSQEQLADYHVVVKTLQPSELNNNLGWINRADLIYINPKTHMNPLVGIWETYNKVGKSPVSNYAKNFTVEDLSWEAVMAIFKKVVVAKDFAGIIIDATTYDPSGPSATAKSNIISYQFGKDAAGNEKSYPNDTLQGNLNNVYKLCLMLRTMNPVIFYNLYLNDNGGTTSPLISQTTVNGKTTGSYNRQPNSDSRLYWTVQTFLPTKPDGSKAYYSDWLNMWNNYNCNPNMYGNTSVKGHVYTYNGDNSLTIEFATGHISYDDRFTKDFMEYVNVTGGTATPAEAVAYILQYKNFDEKSSIHVLDLEPCNEFTLSVQDVREMLLNFTGTINITRQTSAEFIGKFEDLNAKYDMIYMGLNFGAFNVSSGHTVYNDPDLSSKIYLHVGDLIQSNITDSAKAKWGITGANSYNIRLPGNDITNLKADDLEEFLNAGYPIVYDNRFLNGSNINTNYIDASSTINSFIKKQYGKSNFFTYSGAINNNPGLMNCLSIIKPAIKLLSQPVSYHVEEDADAADLANPAYYINGTDPSNRNLSFEFQIADGTEGSEYVAKILIDANADGKFATEEEQCSHTFLSGSQTNTISKKLHESYVGVIPWKLMVYKISKPEIRTEVTGYSAVMKNEEEKKTLSILQINQNNYPIGSYNVSRLNLQNDAIFKQYTEYLNDFKVDFTTITISEFESLYNNSKNDVSNPKIKDNITATYVKTLPATDRLASYDMVILGFSDYYDNISNTNNALNNLADYINSGRSVLCTHDNTSFNNTEGAIGYNFNIMFRDMLGMDRFGVRSSSALVKDDAVKDVTKYPDCRQGYTYYAAMRLSNNNNTYKAYNSINSAIMTKHYGTTKVSKMNDGQLTSYPYRIKNIFTCAETHAQYYQLYMEDPDIVVWYTLQTSTTDTNNMYGASPNDASNNYYIYNKGNITYSGMGHSSITSPADVKEDEVKLFVNTMIASYKAGLKPPSISVKDAIRVSNNEYMKYLDLDPNETTFGGALYQKVEFSITDFNLLSANYPTDDLGTKVTMEDGTPLKIYSASDHIEVTDKVAQFGNPTIHFTKLKNTKNYYILFPMSSFGSSDSKTITFYAETCKGLSTTVLFKFERRTLFDLD